MADSRYKGYDKMTEQIFKAGVGGLKNLLQNAKRRFQSAYVTDTRLMGVVGMYVHWKLLGDTETLDFHQFFRFDAEEFGVEDYQKAIGNDPRDIIMIENSLFGGLGAKKVPITKREACVLLQHYAALSESFGLPLPGQTAEYQSMLTAKINMRPEEEDALFQKQCPALTSNYQVINYFLMRCIGRDFEAASRLSSGIFKLDLFPEFSAATLCQNRIDELPQDGIIYYMCHSIVECDKNYYLLITELNVSEDLEITAYRRRLCKPLSSSEVAMSLVTPEFITVYDIDDNPKAEELVWHGLVGLLKTPISTSYENGELFIAYKKSNDHVNNKVYRLNADIYGTFFISSYGQLIVAAFSRTAISRIEAVIQGSPLATVLMPVETYEFLEPVLYDFIQSDFQDFTEFVAFIEDFDE